MRVLLLGGSGQVGKALLKSAPSGTDIVAPTSQELDLRNDVVLFSIVQQLAPDVVINCAAFTRVDDAESQLDDTRAINFRAPQILAEASLSVKARFLHISTDYVFDGIGPAPYRLTAEAIPLGVYGASKLEGEKAVLETNPDAAIVRTAWVHSGGGINFIATAVQRLFDGKKMRVVDDQVSTPTRALHLAKALWTLANKPEVRGLLHFTDAGVASWYDVAQCVLETLVKAHAAPIGAAVEPVESAVFPRPAKRPAISLLDKHESWKALGYTPPHWRVGVAASVLELLDG